MVRGATASAMRFDLDVVPAKTFRFPVDYRKLTKEMVAAGRYNQQNSNITDEYFPQKGEGIAEFEGRYFNYPGNISSKDVEWEIGQEDRVNLWLPAGAEHILAFGATYPEEQSETRSIVGLGSKVMIEEIHRVLCLRKTVASGRRLDLLHWFGDWTPLFHFLAVRRVSTS